ncbi:MAG TPA: serine hydroxymethyltransferase, partial [Bacilli bacterium]|nr:serine hydroxymethyltransferase [Bacilli bacterium]
VIDAQKLISSTSDQDIIAYAEDCYKKIFGVRFANVKPHTRVIANKIVLESILLPKDKILAFKEQKNELEVYEEECYVELSKYNTVYFNIDEKMEQINYDDIKNKALEERPKIIYINTSFYPRLIDYEELYNIANEINAYLVVDISEIAGLIVTNLLNNPCKYAHITILSTHGVLKGLQGGIILSNNSELIKNIDNNIDSYQGSPLINMIASKVVVANNILNNDFIIYQKQVLKNAKVLCDVFKESDVKVIYNGTDNHEVIIDVKESFSMTGKEAETILKSINIFCKKTLVPYDETTPYITSGIKFSTLVMTSKGLKEKDFFEITKIIVKALKNNKDKALLNNLKAQVEELLTELLF